MNYKIFEKIFSIKNENIHKVITIVGIRFKFKSFKLLEKKCEILSNEILDLINQKKFFMKHNYNPLGWYNKKLKYQNKDFDNIRLCVLELIIRELKNKNLTDGAIAELGVFQGDFASKIGEFLPENKFYLFDTFEGFHQKDKKIEKNRACSEIDCDFSETSVDLVLNKITNPQRCIVKKGYFPESINGLEKKFIFVSIDADLYNPTLEGLKYFYPRLKNGGYIFVHDYNHSQFRGVKQAVIEYLKQHEIKYVPIPDISGSIIITK